MVQGPRWVTSVEGGERRQPVRGVAPRTPGRAKESGPAGGAPRRGGRTRVDGVQCARASVDGVAARHLRHEPRAVAGPGAGGRRPVAPWTRCGGSAGAASSLELELGAEAPSPPARAAAAQGTAATASESTVRHYGNAAEASAALDGGAAAAVEWSSVALRYQKSIRASARFKTQSTGIRKNGYDHPQSGYAWAP